MKGLLETKLQVPKRLEQKPLYSVLLGKIRYEATGSGRVIEAMDIMQGDGRLYCKRPKQDISIEDMVQGLKGKTEEEFRTDFIKQHPVVQVNEVPGYEHRKRLLDLKEYELQDFAEKTGLPYEELKDLRALEMRTEGITEKEEALGNASRKGFWKIPLLFLMNHKYSEIKSYSLAQNPSKAVIFVITNPLLPEGLIIDISKKENFSISDGYKTIDFFKHKESEDPLLGVKDWSIRIISEEEHKKQLEEEEKFRQIMEKNYNLKVSPGKPSFGKDSDIF